MIILLLHFKIFMIITASYAFLVTITQHLGDKRLGVKKIRKRLEVEYSIHISIGRVQRLIKSMALPKISTRIKLRRAKKADEKKPNKYENLLSVILIRLLLIKYG